MTADIPTLIDDAKCINACIPPGYQTAVLISLFAKIAGVSADPADLMTKEVSCINSCIPDGEKLAVIINLLDQIANP